MNQSCSCTISFRCPAKLKKFLNATAERHQLSVSDLIRIVLEQKKRWIAKLRVAQEPVVVAPPCEEEPLVRDKDLHHNIAFLKRAEHGYQGFRFTITRRKHTCRLHFSANDYGSATAALDAAITVRNYVEKELGKRAEEYIQIFEEARLKALSLKLAK